MLFTFLFLGFTVLNVVMEGNSVIDANSLTLINVIANPSILWTTGSNFANLTGAIALPVNLVQLLYKTLLFDYSFLTEGNGIFLRMGYCCFTVGFGWGIANYLRGTSS